MKEGERKLGSLQQQEIKSPEPYILIVSTKFDPHVDIIINKLRERRMPFARLNTEDFPLHSSLTVLFEGTSHAEQLRIPNNPEISGADITAVWYRRPAPFEFPSEFSPAAHVFAEKETRATIRGLWQLLDCLWVNHPESNRIAELKLAQLKAAEKLGLEIPKTLVTNDPEEVEKFFKSSSREVVIKSLSGGLVTDVPDSTAIYTNIVTKETLKQVGRVRYTPALFQEYIPKEVELRTTVVGEQVFTAEIHSQTQGRTLHDWRRDTLKLLHREHQLPKEVESKVLSLTRSFGLEFGAIDMILTPDGRYVFLEINPNGQWAWVEDLTGMPISESLADLLSGRKERK